MKTKIKIFLNDFKVMRRIVLIWCICLTTYAYNFIFDFVNTTENLNVDTAAIIAAILTPISGLQGFVSKLYSENRNNESNVK